jgi:hypothetical protein
MKLFNDLQNNKMKHIELKYQWNLGFLSKPKTKSRRINDTAAFAMLFSGPTQARTVDPQIMSLLL